MKMKPTSCSFSATTLRRLALLGLALWPRPAAPVSPMDVSPGAFSPDGSLYQLEYACRAADRGQLAVGVEAKGGVVLACPRAGSPPFAESSARDSVSKEAHALESLQRFDGSVAGQKLCALGPSIGCASGGLLPDSRMLVDYGRTMVANHWFTYGEAPSLEAVAQALSDALLSFSNHPRPKGEKPPLQMARPFGASLLLAAAGSPCGEVGALFHLSPTGAQQRFRAKAIGAGSKEAEEVLSRALFESLLPEADATKAASAAADQGQGDHASAWLAAELAEVGRFEAPSIAVATRVAVLAVVQASRARALECRGGAALGDEPAREGVSDVSEAEAWSVEVAVASEAGFQVLTPIQISELLARAGSPLTGTS